VTSFCLIRQSDSVARQALARRVVDSLRQTVSQWPPHQTRIVPVNTQEVTLIAIIAQTDGNASLVSFDESDATLVTCWGELDTDVDPTGCARAVRAAYESGGIDSVSSLDGCFAAAIYDKSSGDLVLAQDGVGQRSLRYMVVNGITVTSPHDLPLVATGIVPIEPDLTTAASIAALGWSVGDASLLTRISSCAPGQIRTILPQGDVRIDPHPYHAVARVALDDDQAIKAQREQLITQLRNHIPATVGDADEVKIELSAGFDSRAVLGAAVSTLGRERLAGFSDGDQRSLDVRVAGQVASKTGIRFSGNIPADAGDDARFAYVTGLAIDTNGQANALVGMTDFIPRDLDAPLPSLCGDGGEIFRGYYYPKIGHQVVGNADPHELAQTLLKKSRAAELPWQERHEESLATRIKQRTTFIAHLAEKQVDALDLLYLLERFAVWNQKLRRNRHQRLRSGPFFSRAAIRTFLSLPAPRGQVAGVHETLVKRFAPETLSILVNREFHVGLLTGNRLQRLLGKAVVYHRKIVRKLQKKLSRFAFSRNGATNDLEAVRAERFVELLKGRAGELLCGPAGLGTALFGETAMRTMVDRAISGDRRDVQTLGALVTAELWLDTARAVRNVAVKHRTSDPFKTRDVVRSA
jgi:hypothetical protein